MNQLVNCLDGNEIEFNKLPILLLRNNQKVLDQPDKAGQRIGEIAQSRHIHAKLSKRLGRGDAIPLNHTLTT